MKRKKRKKKKHIKLVLVIVVAFVSGVFVGSSFGSTLLPVTFADSSSIRESVIGVITDVQNNISDLLTLDTAANSSTQTTTLLGDVELYGPYSVVRVVDGDTMVLNINNEDSKVRLIGVDTPESVHRDSSKNTDEGKDASAWVTDLLTDSSVYLEYDVSQTDRYGRILAYVYLDDSRTMLNRLLLEKGLATVMTIQPNSKYADDFYEIQVVARESGLGFWGTGFFTE